MLNLYNIKNTNIKKKINEIELKLGLDLSLKKSTILENIYFK
jgi:hypothetical protein